MALEAIFVSDTPFIKNAPDFVGGMAIDAHGHFVRFFFPEFAFDDLFVHSFNQTVALLTGLGHVVTVNRRPGIGMG